VTLGRRFYQIVEGADRCRENISKFPRISHWFAHAVVTGRGPRLAQ